MNDSHTIVAFLTGQSDSSSDALSQSQWEFLSRSPVPEAEKMRMNFPYSGTAAGWRSIPLWQASIHNTLQYWTSRHEAFSLKYREHIMATFAGYERMIFLAGSCGLELLVNLRLPPEFMQRVHVFAYGPVSRSLPECALLWRVRGRQDHLSKRWHPVVDHILECGHMDYLESLETQRLFSDFYQKSTSPL